MNNKQTGGIVSFVVVGVVLAGLLAGALYLSKQQGREARTDTPAPQIAERNTDTQKAPAEKTSREKYGSADARCGEQRTGQQFC